MHQASSVYLMGKKPAISVPCGAILGTASHINFQVKDRTGQRGRHYSSGSSGSPPEGHSGDAGLGQGSFVPQGTVRVSWDWQPWEGTWLWEMWCSSAGAGTILSAPQTESHCTRFKAGSFTNSLVCFLMLPQMLIFQSKGTAFSNGCPYVIFQASLCSLYSKLLIRNTIISEERVLK